MLFLQWKIWASSCLIIQVFIIFSALYVYRENAKRAPDDPEKKDFPPRFPWLAPFILPILALINLPLLVLSSLAFGITLLLFPFALLLFRKPFLIKWIIKQAKKIGNLVFTINSQLLKALGLYMPSIKLQIER
jgi:hypothetical protein